MFKHAAFFAFAISVAMLISSCISTPQTYTRVAPGIWRGVLSLEHYHVPVRDKDTIFVLHEQFKPGELPFNFEVNYTDEERFTVTIFNGEERILCDSIVYGRDRSQARDTFNIFFPEYQSYLHCEVRGGVMQGEWVVTTKQNYRIPFYAHAGKNYRFTPMKEIPEGDLTGSWATMFGVDGKEEPSRAIGEFKQEGNRLTGTFRTESGDYRFLEGTVQGRKFYLSTFDGSHAYLFAGSIKGDSLQGEFRSGTHYSTLWTSWRDPNFKLRHPDSISTMQAGKTFSFSLATPEGQPRVYPSDHYAGKIKIFTITGTWCPNCRDEQIFLRDFLKNNPEAAKDVVVNGISFERTDDAAKANAQLQRYKATLGLSHELLFAGKTEKDAAAKMFPSLSSVEAFPTMIVIDKNDKVRRIHTGFDGPATSKFAAFSKEFEALIATLRSENVQ